MLDLQNIILEMIAKGSPLASTTDRLCSQVEALLPDVICSVLTVDRARLLHPLSAPSLPADYSAALDGIAIGPDVGSCGTSAYLRTPVAVTDIANDAKWAEFKHHASQLGLKACWSSPIFGANGTVLGTFAFYYRERRGPTDVEREVVATCTHLCAIAMERHDRALEHERKANIDELTGLLNRASFNRALASLPCDVPAAWAIMVLDLDNLKVTNDTFGHHVGDALLREVASRLAINAVPAKAFRIGGDEFAVILQAPEALRDIFGTAQELLDCLVEPALCAGHLIAPQATIGGAVLAHGDATPDSVRQNADFALYHAKETGRGGFVRYWPGIGTAITKRLTAIRDLGAALREDRVEAYYQPIVRLDTREIVGVEALCRIITPAGDVIPAAAFSDATSDAQIACALTECMLGRIVADLRNWLDLGIPIQHVGLNVSYADVHRGKLGGQLSAAFAAADVPLKHLIVEITENVYMGRRDHVIAREIKAMRALGLRVALDDFGTGFASLTHLLTVPVDILKIDKSFVDNLSPGTPSSVIVEGLQGIANKLGIRVVAEGIETESQAAQLAAFGCLLGQGYLFSPAVDRDAMTDFLLRLAQPSAETARGAARLTRRRAGSADDATRWIAAAGPGPTNPGPVASMAARGSRKYPPACRLVR
ncbi:EAL domain-containing protein [Sphingomonas sp. JC676]|uniref:putative bifunctional diguanylate cyclase/phosphodiesterase n=1 Tax=Sphingomonas sp. JC676 TaxID=2768065 RepID=UPI001657783C|nr:EAL domain-containing protein [Sphingomonas sp. JC676]MBC9030821.1 EAL domain-containing protein [Sphingomonas sp. JC676]